MVYVYSCGIGRTTFDYTQENLPQPWIFWIDWNHWIDQRDRSHLFPYGFIYTFYQYLYQLKCSTIIGIMLDYIQLTDFISFLFLVIFHLVTYRSRTRGWIWTLVPVGLTPWKNYSWQLPRREIRRRYYTRWKMRPI